MTGSLVVREVIPATSAEADLETGSGQGWVDERYRREGPYVRLNMITSLTGGAAGFDGTSESLTSRVDRTILAAIRRASDVVVVGAQTVRTEGVRRPRGGTLAVVTRGDLTAVDAQGLRRSVGRAGAVLVICPEVAAARTAPEVEALDAEIVTVPGLGGSASPTEILDALAARGLSRVVCEGGPSIASQFVAAGVVDELCVTVAPVVGTPPPGGPFLRLPPESVPHTTVAGMLVDAAGFSYLRLSVSASAPDPARAPSR